MYSSIMVSVPSGFCIFSVSGACWVFIQWWRRNLYESISGSGCVGCSMFRGSPSSTSSNGIRGASSIIWNPFFSSSLMSFLLWLYLVFLLYFLCLGFPTFFNTSRVGVLYLVIIFDCV